MLFLIIFQNFSKYLSFNNEEFLIAFSSLLRHVVHIIEFGTIEFRLLLIYYLLKSQCETHKSEHNNNSSVAKTHSKINRQ